MYPNLRRAVEERARETIEDMRRRLTESSCKDALSNWYLKSLMTPVAMRLIKSESPDSAIPEEAVNKMMSRVSRGESKRFLAEIEKLDNAEKSGTPDYIYVTVEWARSREYGANPTATVCAGGVITVAKASGCGYDKESACISYAMNKNSAVTKLWYDRAEDGRQFPYSMVGGIADKSLPTMDGGCGMQSMKEVFAALGYKCTESHGKMFDSYTFEKEDKNGKSNH